MSSQQALSPAPASFSRADLRRRERRQDIVEELRKHYRVADVIDYSAFEDEGYYLEGTGSLLVFARTRGASSASLEKRTATLPALCASNYKGNIVVAGRKS